MFRNSRCRPWLEHTARVKRQVKQFCPGVLFDLRVQPLLHVWWSSCLFSAKDFFICSANKIDVFWKLEWYSDKMKEIQFASTVTCFSNMFMCTHDYLQIYKCKCNIRDIVLLAIVSYIWDKLIGNRAVHDICVGEWKRIGIVGSCTESIL